MVKRVQDGNGPLRQRKKRRVKGRATPGSYRPVVDDRARLVVQWFRDGGMPRAEIVRRTGLTDDMVGRWWKRQDTETRPGEPMINSVQELGQIKH